MRAARRAPWLGALALVSTVGAILLFFAGLARVGPSTASILAILEPVVTVAGAAVVFDETLTAVQWVGGALVLGAVVVVQWRVPEVGKTGAATGFGSPNDGLTRAQWHAERV